MEPYAYIYDESRERFVPQIADGTFKGVRVDHLPLAKSPQQAAVYLQALDFVYSVGVRPTRVYFNFENSDKIAWGTRKEQQNQVLEMLAEKDFNRDDVEF